MRSSRTFPAWARRSSRGASRARSACRFAPRPGHARPAAQLTSLARACWRATSFRFMPGPGLHQRPARRRDQPRHATDAERATRGDGRGPGLDRGSRPGPCPIRSWSWPRRTRSSSRALSRCRKRSLTGSSFDSRLATPTRRDERQIASRYRASADPLSAVEPIVDGPTLLAMRETVRRILVADTGRGVRRRVSCARTRDRKEVRIGGSPRASVALYRAAQAHAFLDGRGFVLPDDVKAVALAVLNHRVILDLDYSLRGSNAIGPGRQALSHRGAVPPLDSDEQEAWQAANDRPWRRRGADRRRRTAAARPASSPSASSSILVWLLRSLWTRFGLRGVTYERKLGATRALVGEEIPLELTVRNRKLLPLPWLEVEDFVSEDAHFADRPLEPSDQPGFRHPAYDLDAGLVPTRHAPREHRRRAARNVRLQHRTTPRRRPIRPGQGRRGARRQAALSRRAALRTGTRNGPDERVARRDASVPRGLFEDPALFAGVRPYQPGDPLRRIHWKATARLGTAGQPTLRPGSRARRGHRPRRPDAVRAVLDDALRRRPGREPVRRCDVAGAQPDRVRHRVRTRVNAYTIAVDLALRVRRAELGQVADRADRRSAGGHQPLAVTAIRHTAARHLAGASRPRPASSRSPLSTTRTWRPGAAPPGRSGRRVQLVALGRNAPDATARARALGVPAATWLASSPIGGQPMRSKWSAELVLLWLATATRRGCVDHPRQHRRCSG